MTRFKELRKEKHLTQEELITNFNLKYGKSYTAAAISQFENGKRTPETKSLADFADFFDVSIDYLLGLTDKRHYNGYSSNAPREAKCFAMPPSPPQKEKTHDASSKEKEFFNIYVELMLNEIKNEIRKWMADNLDSHHITEAEQALLDAYRNAPADKKTIVNLTLGLK